MIRRPGGQLQGNREAQAMLIHQLDFNVGSIANVDTIGSENWIFILELNFSMTKYTQTSIHI